MANVLLVMNQAASVHSDPATVAEEQGPLWLAFGCRKRVDPDACVEAKVQLWESAFNRDICDSALRTPAARLDRARLLDPPAPFDHDAGFSARLPPPPRTMQRPQFEEY